MPTEKEVTELDQGQAITQDQQLPTDYLVSIIRELVEAVEELQDIVDANIP